MNAYSDRRLHKKTAQPGQRLDEHAPLQVAAARTQSSCSPLDQGQQVVAKDLKHQAHVTAVRACVLKRINHSHAMLVIGWVAVPELAEQDDLISGCICVVLGALLHLRASQNQSYSFWQTMHQLSSAVDRSLLWNSQYVCQVEISWHALIGLQPRPKCI
jgi:hypothetical protein